MNTINRGIRNAFRNTIRSVSIITILGLSLGLAMAMLIANQAVGQKIDSIKSSVGNTVSVSPAGVRGFEGGGNALTADQLKPIASIAHVTSVNETLNDRLTTSDTNLVSSIDAGSLGRRFAANSGTGDVTPPTPPGNQGTSADGTTRTFTPPVTVSGTNTPTTLGDTQGGGTFKLTSGKVFDSGSTENVAVIGSSLATKNNLKIGSTFTAYGTTITIIGIYDAGNTFANNQVIMPLSTVQTLSAQPGAITGATVNVDSVSNIDSVTSAIQAKLGTAADVTNSAEQAKTVIQPLQNIQSISLYSLIGALGAGAVIILLTMIMIVRERRREIGVIKAIGASNAKVVGQFMVEAITLTTLGAVVGIIIGVIAGNPITHLLVTNSTNTATTAVGGMQRGGARFARGAFGGVRNNLTSINGTIGWEIILYGLLASLLIAVVGSAIAAYFIAKVRPAEVMRAE